MQYGNTNALNEEVENPFDIPVSWQDFHEQYRPLPPYVPNFANLDTLQPRYPRLPPQLLQQSLLQLTCPYSSLTPEMISQFRQQRWIRLKQVLPPPLLLAARESVIKLASAATDGKNISHPDDSIYMDGFFPDEPELYWELISEPATQSWNIQMMWAVDPYVRALVCNPRIGTLLQQH